MQKKIATSYAIEILFIIIGLVFNYLEIGLNKMFNFGSVGYFLIYVGIVGILITTLKIKKKKKKIDERMIQIAFKSSRLTMVFLILGAFIIMIIDGIKPITIRYNIFMSYFIIILLLFNLITYYIMLRRS